MIKIDYWVFKTVSDSERSYQSIDGYKDDIEKYYNYDSAVANYKNVKVGDIALIVDKTEIIGIGKINNISETQGKKTRTKCPICGSTNYTIRKTIKPKFRCNKSHEFETLISETVDITKYTATYGKSYIKSDKVVPISELKPYFDKNYNRNMSIQHLDRLFFSKHYNSIINKLVWNPIFDLDPYDAITDEPSTIVDAYIPNENDERRLVLRQIKERRGQKSFRDSIIKRYGEKCMVTGCSLLDILEAAHIKPYRGEKDNDPSNGLLLRSDIHTLFDLNLLGINPTTLTIHFTEIVKNHGYSSFHGLKLQGITKSNRPNYEALRERWQHFNSNS